MKAARSQKKVAQSASNMTASQTVSAPAPAAAAKKLHILEGDEIVQLLIKPSLWYIVVISWRWIAGMLLLSGFVTAMAQGGWTSVHTLFLQAALLIGLGRLAFALLQWTSRVYVLTNRRVMRITGVFRADLRSCLLSRINAVTVRTSSWQHMLGLGSVLIRPADENLPTVNWNFVSRPKEIREVVEQAIGRSHHSAE